MSLTNRPMTFGAARLTIYDFEDVGDELAPHAHQAMDNHVSIVARGRFRVSGNGWQREVAAGAIVDFEPGQVHGFVALEPRSRIINVLKAAPDAAAS